MLSLVPAMVVLALTAGVWAFVAFIAIVVFAAVAFTSLSRHLRRSRRPWPGEPGYHDDRDDPRPGHR